MSDEVIDEVNQAQDRIWYIRKNGKVYGPMAASRVRNHVIEGKVELSDEASKNKKLWKTLRSLPELIPLQMRNPEVLDEVESLKDKVSGTGSFWLTTVIVLLVVGGVIAAAMFYQPAEDNTAPDCEAAPKPSINWNNCNKRNLLAENVKLDSLKASNAVFKNARFSGASMLNATLNYAHLEEADLTYTNLSGASLKGANLQDADLGNAILNNADLRYADLSGAQLGGVSLQGAKLTGAVWFNGKTCQKGSVGKCVE